MPKQRTHEEYVEEIKRINPNIEILNTYINSKTRIKYRCECGLICSKKAYSLLSHPQCASCGNKKGSTTRLTHDEFISKMKIVSPNITILGIYESSKVDIKYLCDCGNISYASPNTLLKGIKCRKCGSVRGSDKRKYTHDYVVKRVGEISPSIKILSPYISSQEKVRCECLTCGHKWDVVPDSLLNMKTGCPSCKKSKGENLVEKYLLKYNIDFTKQHRIKACRNIYPLPFDFAIWNNNKLLCLIEYDGAQHFSTWHKIKNAAEKLRQIQFRDNIKNDYCKNNNIKLIEIPYWNINKIENILISELNITNNKGSDSLA